MEYERLFSQMIREMVSRLKTNQHNGVKTVTVNRLLLMKLVQFIAVEQSLKEADIANEMSLSKRTWGYIKSPESDAYISMRLATVDFIIEYVYSLAELLEQKVEMVWWKTQKNKWKRKVRSRKKRTYSTK